VNSDLVTSLIELQSNAGKFMSGIIKTLPWQDLACDSLKKIEDDTISLVRQLRAVNAMEETSAFYCGLPIHSTIALLVQAVRDASASVRDNMQVIDQEWNRLVNRAYGVNERDVRQLQDLNVYSNDETESNAREEEDIIELTDNEIAGRLVSYLFGIAFGRWNPDSRLQAEIVVDAHDPYDRDGLLVDDADHKDDMIRRLRDVLEVIWKTEAYAIEKEASQFLGVKELRDYFRKPGKGGFWDEHISRYSKSRRKAPIYWLLQSSKKNYGLWLYYHRLDKDLLFKALVNYVEPKIRLETSRLESFRGQKVSVGETSKEAKRIAKDVERQDDFLSELRDFEDKLRRAANLHLEPDLNDGVVLNIAPLWALVPWKEAKKYWDELMEGQYEWSSIGKQLRAKGLVK
jgi:hypothetical protein